MKSLLKSDFGTTLKMVIYSDIYVGAGYVLSHNSTESIHGKMEDLHSRKHLYIQSPTPFSTACAILLVPPRSLPSSGSGGWPPNPRFLPLPRVTLASTAATSIGGGGDTPTLRRRRELTAHWRSIPGSGAGVATAMLRAGGGWDHNVTVATRYRKLWYSIKLYQKWI
jgi:hypothetical protein